MITRRLAGRSWPTSLTSSRPETTRLIATDSCSIQTVSCIESPPTQDENHWIQVAIGPYTLRAPCHGRSVAAITGSYPSRMVSAGDAVYGLPPRDMIRPYAA